MRTQSTYYNGSNFNPQNLNKVFKDKTGASEIYGSIFGENSRNPVSQDEYGEFIFINKGQTLSKIFGSPKNIDAVCKANGIKDKNKIQAGIKLYISSNGISQESQEKISIKTQLPGNIEKHFLKENDNLKQIGSSISSTVPGLSADSKPISGNELQNILKQAGINIDGYKIKTDNDGEFLQKELGSGEACTLSGFDDNGVKKFIQTITTGSEVYNKVFEVKTPQQYESKQEENNIYIKNWELLPEYPQLSALSTKDISEYGLKENNNLSVLYEDEYNPDSTPGLSGDVRAVSGNELSDILKTAGLNIQEYDNKKGQDGVFLQKTIEGGAVQYLRAVKDEDGRKLIQTVKNSGKAYTKIFQIKP